MVNLSGMKNQQDSKLTRHRYKYISGMEVIKRDGSREKVSFDKVIRRVEQICERLNLKRVDPIEIAKETIQGLYDGITTEELDFFAAHKCAERIIDDPEYNDLAAGLCVSNLHKSTTESFMEVTEKLYNNTDRFGNKNPLVTEEYYNNVKANIDIIQAAIDYQRDYLFDFFGIKTLERAYLIRIKEAYINNSTPQQKEIKSEMLMRQKYGRIIERPQHMIMRLALGIHCTDLKSALESYDLVSKHYFTHASPTLYNAGAPKPQLSSCYLLNMEDSIDGIFDTVSDAAKISKWAGGIGINISNIRASGSLIRGTNGNSDGIVPLIRLLNAEARYVNQGGRRNGAIAVYLEPWHVDVYNFCELRKNTGAEEVRARDIFLALWIPDIFMKRVKDKGLWSLMCPDECPNLTTTYGEEFEELYLKYEKEGRYRKQVSATELWFHILSAQIETGMPYMLFKDNVNKQSNQINVGVIQCSNLCVSGDTYVLTDKGQVQIKEIVNKRVDIWNGEEWSGVQIKKTGENKDLMRIKFSNGVEIKCTPEHKFYIVGGARNQKKIMVDANELKLNDNLIKYQLPTDIKIDSTNDMKYPYTHGFFCGDGTTYDNYSRTVKYPKVALYGEKKELQKYLEHTSSNNNHATKTIDLVLPKDMKEKFFVPLNQSLTVTLRWLEGYFDADGTIARNGENESLQIGSINSDFLIKVKLMLQTIGIDSKVTKALDADIKILPDGKGGKKEYNTQPLYRLLVNSSELYKLTQLGFSPKRLKFDKREPQRDASHFVKVTSIESNYSKEDTYCFTENKRHMGMFNGILTGQCSEIVEYTNFEEIAVCNLASICLPAFLNDDKTYDFKKLQHVAEVITRNLNRVIDINYYPIKKAQRSNFRHRPIGVGVQGLADLFCLLDIPFDSEEALKLNKKIFETIYFGCLTASMELAKEDGPYETFAGSPFSKGQLQYHLWGLSEDDLVTNSDLDWYGLVEDIKKYGTRNSLLTTIMPTASTSQIMGYNESIEAFTTNLYTRTTLAGEYVLVNKHLVNKLIPLGLWTSSIREEFVFDNGSIQNIADIPSEIKAVFKTAFEMKMKPMVQQAVVRGPFIDQSQSMNLFLNEPNFHILTSSHFYAWSNKLKTGMYYLRSRPAVDPIKFGLDPLIIKKIQKRRGLKQSNNEEDVDESNTNESTIPGQTNESKDPRRMNEIEVNQKKDRIVSCEMCSG